MQSVIFSLGGVRRGLLTIALLVSFSLSACSGDPSDVGAADAADPNATAEAAVKDLTSRYWAVVVKAENNADPDPDQFEPVARGTFIEAELKRLRTYQDGDLRRVGAPAITDVEAVVTGDTAEIKACLDEDKWGAELKGTKVKPTSRGPAPWGATAERIDGTWLVTDIGIPAEGEKTCPS